MWWLTLIDPSSIHHPLCCSTCVYFVRGSPVPADFLQGRIGERGRGCCSYDNHYPWLSFHFHTVWINYQSANKGVGEEHFLNRRASSATLSIRDRTREGRGIQSVRLFLTIEPNQGWISSHEELHAVPERPRLELAGVHLPLHVLHDGHLGVSNKRH